MSTHPTSEKASASQKSRVEGVNRAEDECRANVLAERDALKAQCERLRNALSETTRCLAWHEERHGVAMDRKAVEDARAALESEARK